MSISYCPSPKLEAIRSQAKTHMTLEVFERALVHVQHYVDQGTQGELSLTGIGETLLHPRWREMVAMARRVLTTERFLNFSTNGLLLDDDACAFLASEGVGVYVSLHRPEKAGPALMAAKRHGILMDVNAGASLNAMDWAGQVDWYVSAEVGPCDWLKDGWANVLVDGRVTACCLDAGAKGVFGTVDDEPGSWKTSPFELCGPCHLTPVEPETNNASREE